MGMLLLLASVALFFFIVDFRRHQYISKVHARGWEYYKDPTEDVVIGLNNPPFGVGADRDVTCQIVGRSANGTPFQSFKYKCSKWNSGFSLVIAAQLDRSLPEFYSFRPKSQLPNVQGIKISDGPGMPLQVASDYRYGNLMKTILDPLIYRLSETNAVTVTIDHNHLVVIYCPNKVEAVEDFVEEMARCIQIINTHPGLEEFHGPVAPNTLSFHLHPHWSFHTREDIFLSYVSHNTEGYDHQAKNIVYREDGPLPFIGLTHEWKTKTEDKDSKSSQEKKHTEYLLEFQLAFPFVPFSINYRKSLIDRTPVVRFELDEFNRKYKIRCINPKFISDVLHPRTIEYVLHNEPPPFWIDDQLCLRFQITKHDEQVIGSCEDFLYNLFSRTPGFVWKDLGTSGNPFK